MGLIILSAIFVLVGLLGILLPLLPGVLLSWAGLYLYAYQTGFESISKTTIVVLLVISLLTHLLDYALPLLGATKYKASAFGVIGSVIGLVLGIVFLGPVGIVAGPFLGAFAGEIIAQRSREQAMQVAFGTLLGFLVSVILKLSLGLVILGYFIAALFA